MFPLTSKKPTPFKKWHAVLLGIVLIIGLISWAYSFYWPHATVQFSTDSYTNAYRVLVADTFRHEYEGWSNKDTMGKNDGMLFVFPTRASHIMVMRGMRFPLDIVWIDGDTVVYSAQNVALEPGRNEADLTKYGSPVPSTQVIEFRAGFIAQTGLKVGDKVRITEESLF